MAKKICILRWEGGQVPQALLDLENLPGNSTNPASYPFELYMIQVKGANMDTVLLNPSQKLLEDMIELCKELIEKEGIEGFTTSCGFNAIFQKQMADALPVPVFTSSLLQVPFAHSIIGKGKKVAIVTANKSKLTKEHLACCNITDDMNYEVFGLEGCKEWSKMFSDPDAAVDMAVVTEEVLGTICDAVKGGDFGAIVFECTDLPPFAPEAKIRTGLPVFSINSLIGHMAIVLGEMPLFEKVV